jgi:energy-coupling factor transporter ATP-binding protein EcfA2
MKHLISIEIQNSTFFDSPLKITFSENLNCIMGSRGTGKSTLIHFIKSCLDKEAEESRITYNVLKNNLGGGLVTLTLQDEEGKKYKIEKSLEEDPQPYTLPKNTFVDLRKIANIVECDIYEAQAIEEIGKNSKDRLELIDKMIPSEKVELENEISGIQLLLDENTQLIKSENSRLKKQVNELKTHETAEEELAKLLEEKPDDINKKEQAEFENADKNEKSRTGEKRYVKIIEKKLGELQSFFEETLEDISAFKTTNSKTDHFLNKDLINKISTESLAVFGEVTTALKELLKKMEKSSSKIDFASSQLSEKHSVQQNEFAKLKQKFDKHKEFYNKWNALSKKVDEKKNIEKDIDGLKGRRNKVLSKREQLVTQLNVKKKELFDLRISKILELNTSFAGAIKITLGFGGITDEYEQLLRNALRGSNMRYNTLIPALVQNFTPNKFAAIVHSKDHDTLKKIAGIDKERAAAIFTALFETDDIYEIEKLYCPDLPEFLLKVDARNDKGAKSRDNYRKSEDLSTGQRCTTVLPIVFAVSNNPLIIDQPEDNLDNKYISDSIHKIIRSQKESRQLIFITHNPNIPVLSESEKNLFLNYSDKKSVIEKQGDIEAVKDHILNLLEGGKEAFEKREILYGLKRN